MGLLSRIGCLVLALVAAGFVQAHTTLAPLADQLARVASAIEEGRSAGGVRQLLAEVGEELPPCDMGIARDHAVLAIASERGGQVASGKRPPAREVLAHALTCQPSDGFIWALSAEQHLLERDLAGAAEALSQSRRFAPREGHVLIRRQFAAWSVYDLLPQDERDATLDEFALLVEGAYFPEAVAIIKSEGAARSADFGDALVTVSLLSRQLFAKYLYPRDSNVEVPGISRTAVRPAR